mmetsp:Transcript_47798/g.89489  ORF Transcript_47798/g.89489 Transcript_47798/m.89489 type:complete len:404 (-) Transcript_47798:2327-3538(-)
MIYLKRADSKIKMQNSHRHQSAITLNRVTNQRRTAWRGRTAKRRPLQNRHSPRAQQRLLAATTLLVLLQLLLLVDQMMSQQRTSQVTPLEASQRTKLARVDSAAGTMQQDGLEIEEKERGSDVEKVVLVLMQTKARIATVEEDLGVVVTPGGTGIQMMTDVVAIGDVMRELGGSAGARMGHAAIGGMARDAVMMSPDAEQSGLVVMSGGGGMMLVVDARTTIGATRTDGAVTQTCGAGLGLEMPMVVEAGLNATGGQRTIAMTTVAAGMTTVVTLEMTGDSLDDGGMMRGIVAEGVPEASAAGKTSQNPAGTRAPGTAGESAELTEASAELTEAPRTAEKSPAGTTEVMAVLSNVQMSRARTTGMRSSVRKSRAEMTEMTQVPKDAEDRRIRMMIEMIGRGEK